MIVTILVNLMDAMNSGISLDIFTFKQLPSIVLPLIETLCAPKIYFELVKFTYGWAKLSLSLRTTFCLRKYVFFSISLESDY